MFASSRASFSRRSHAISIFRRMAFALADVRICTVEVWLRSSRPSGEAKSLCSDRFSTIGRVDGVVDLSEPVLNLFEILVEPEFENVADGGVSEIVTEPAG